MIRPPRAKNIVELTAAAAESGRILYSDHANRRLCERTITKPEVEYVLIAGFHEARKDRFNEKFQSWDYAIRGDTVDRRTLRIVVAVISPGVLIVTAIDLSKR